MSGCAEERQLRAEAVIEDPMKQLSLLIDAEASSHDCSVFTRRHNWFSH